jgi:hypothetical protein
MISLDLARRLRDAGLAWEPAAGDRFIVPDRNLDEQVFWVSEMSVEARSVPGGRILAFNGTAEWALDSILQGEVVWLPSEAQLRELLGDAFESLRRIPGGFRCEIMIDGTAKGFEHAGAAESYGRALLSRLEADREARASSH